MIDYELGSTFYLEEEKAKIFITINEGDYIGTQVLIEELEILDDDCSNMEVTYSIIENPLGVPETDEEFVSVFGEIMNDVLERVVNAVIEEDKSKSVCD